MSAEEFLTLVGELRKSGGFAYDLGKGDFFVDVFASAKPTEQSLLDTRRINMLRRALRQPDALFCGGEVQPDAAPACCYAHIAKHRKIQHWQKASDDLDAQLRNKMTVLDTNERTPEEVLKSIHADGWQAGDVDVCVSTWASGALSARLKGVGKEFVLEVTSNSDHGTIENVRKITIFDTATGTESDGTRWTAEAPFVEGFEGLPVGGSDPLAFFNAFPYLVQKVRWFGGITGTLGGPHNIS